MAEKLPVVATITEAVAVFRALAPDIARVGWLTLVVMTAQSMLFDGAVVMQEPSDEGDWLGRFLFTFSLGLLNLPVLTSVHRLVLQGQGGRVGLVIAREEGMFLWAGFRMLPMIMLAALPIGVILGLSSTLLAAAVQEGDGGAALLLVVLRMLSSVALALFACRYLLVFPAAAVGRKLSLAEAARLLKGRLLGFCLILFLVWFASWLPQVPLFFLARVIPMTAALLSACCGTISTLLFAVTLALVYRRLAGEPDAGPSDGTAFTA